MNYKKSFLFIFTCLSISYSFAMQKSHKNFAGAMPMSADAAALLNNMAASSSSSSAAPIRKHSDRERLAISRAVMLECKDSQGAAGLPPVLFNIVNDYLWPRWEPIKSVQLLELIECNTLAMAMSPNGQKLACVLVTPPQARPLSNVICRYDMSSKKLTTVHELDKEHCPNPPAHQIITAAAVRSDGRMSAQARANNCMIVTVSNEGIDEAHEEYRDRKIDGVATAIAISSDRKKFASATSNGMKIWDVESGKCLTTFSQGFIPCHALALSPEGTILVAGSKTGRLKIFDTASGACLDTIKGHPEEIKALSMPNEQTIISLSNNQTLRTWKLINNRDQAMIIIKEKEEAAKKERWCSIQ